VKESQVGRKITVNVSFLQLYNEKIFDLLNTDMFKRKPGDKKMVFNMGSNNPEQGLKLKWNQFDVYDVPNLINVEISSYEDIITLFHHGIKNKIIGSHRMNMNSSRSHTIFCMTVE
jgi:hypothetical protein